MKRLALVLVSFVILAVSLPKSGIAGERRIPLTEYADKVRAAWLGKMAGVGWGITTEFRYSHRLVPDSMMQPWCVKRVNEGYNQDDLYLSLLSLELLRKYGPEVSARTACIERQNLQFEYGGRNPLVFRDSIAPPDLGHPHYKPTSDGCGYTCGADFSGIVAPGLPAAPVRFAASFGTDRCYGDGLYGGIFVGAMYCEAFFTADLRRIVEEALRAIPERSLVACAVRDVMHWHRLYPDDWKRTWQLIMDKYWWNEENNWIAWPYGGVRKGINLDSKSMAAMSVMALLYGEGDLHRTMRIAVQGSEDSDCNASIAAGVLLASRGMAVVDEELLGALNRERRFKYFSRTFDGMVDLTLEVVESLDLARMLDRLPYCHTPADSAYAQSFSFPENRYIVRKVTPNASDVNTIGIHSRGSGWTEFNPEYAFPVAPEGTADTLQWQITRVEDLIIDECALEMAFEGHRFGDLMRVAMRRGDPSYLADRVYARRGADNAGLMQGLIARPLNDPHSWYMSWQGQIGY